MSIHTNFYQNLRVAIIFAIISCIFFVIFIFIEKNKTEIISIYGNAYFIFEKKRSNGMPIKYIIIPKYKTKTMENDIEVSLFLFNHTIKRKIPLFRSLTGGGHGVPILTDDEKYSLAILEGMSLYRYNNGRDDFLNLFR